MRRIRVGGVRSAGVKLLAWSERPYRLATARRRSLPHFLVIGAMKAGTTSLYRHLGEHPQVALAGGKEIHFFDIQYDRGLDWYRSHFPYQAKLESEGLVTGEASPYYLFHPAVPGRVAETLPDVKLIALLRNPVDRAYSHYAHAVRRGREKLNFEEALENEGARLEEERLLPAGKLPRDGGSHRRHSYLSRGIYVNQLKRWEWYYERGRLAVICAEELFSHPDRVFPTILDFLELGEWLPPSFGRLNVGQHPRMRDEQRQRLMQLFEPANEQLFKFLGRRFDWS